MVEPSSDSRYVVSSRFPALARNGTILFLMGRDAVVGVAKGLSWTPQWRDKDCSVSPKGGGGGGGRTDTTLFNVLCHLQVFLLIMWKGADD